MTERLLQFIWQFQYFNKTELLATTGDPVSIIYPGNFNAQQGPDFLEARIKIGDALWIGNVEVHVLSSGWTRHAHHRDHNYDNVILHVVWIDDAAGSCYDMPTLLLQDRIFKLLLQQYEIWMNSRSFIPCAGNVLTAGNMTWIAWKERLLIERVKRKYDLVTGYLQQNNYHWEETCWWMLAKNFGLSVNTEACPLYPFTAIVKTQKPDSPA